VSGAEGWTSVHATAIVVGEQGVLVQGPSGAGKSGLALALIARARERATFAALISDDRVFLRACGGRLLTRGPLGFEGLIEQRFEGVVAMPHERCAVARLVVELAERGCPGPRLPEDSDKVTQLLGVSLPRLTLDPAHGPLDHAYAALQTLARLR
jgi:serine kinase of HPr protein (carbohydrate metabolism regulator)